MVYQNELMLLDIDLHKRMNHLNQSYKADYARWKSVPKDLLVKYKGADVFPDNRVVFHCFDGEFKLLTLAIFGSGLIVVNNIGTIAEYGKCNL